MTIAVGLAEPLRAADLTAHLLCRAGDVFRIAGDRRSAREYYDRAINLARSTSAEYTLARADEGRALLTAADGDIDGALTLLDAAAARYERRGLSYLRRVSATRDELTDHRGDDAGGSGHR